MEWLRFVEFVAILCADLVSMKVPLSLPGSSIKEVHGGEEARGCDGSLTSLRRLHRVVVIDSTLVGDEFAEVATGLEPRV